jgi:hypothetical protein
MAAGFKRACAIALPLLPMGALSAGLASARSATTLQPGGHDLVTRARYVLEPPPSSFALLSRRGGA